MRSLPLINTNALLAPQLAVLAVEKYIQKCTGYIAVVLGFVLYHSTKEAYDFSKCGVYHKASFLPKEDDILLKIRCNAEYEQKR